MLMSDTAAYERANDARTRTLIAVLNHQAIRFCDNMAPYPVWNVTVLVFVVSLLFLTRAALQRTSSIPIDNLQVRQQYHQFKRAVAKAAAS